MSLPHARGGVSAYQALALDEIRSSPRPWGCFPANCLPLSLILVFPTPVGVFPPSNYQ
ncbi:conserved hypothetical protein [methanotrophic bacterial endosymbiont of Bathymodiolus sp.]|nr:conserved hypothetical protein [methanotrophic bacterial endosymbiont of Bathymodiolus sp.]